MTSIRGIIKKFDCCVFLRFVENLFRDTKIPVKIISKFLIISKVRPVWPCPRLAQLPAAALTGASVTEQMLLPETPGGIPDMDAFSRKHFSDFGAQGWQAAFPLAGPWQRQKFHASNLLFYPSPPVTVAGYLPAYLMVLTLIYVFRIYDNWQFK
jgi:hypothetical protein